MNYCNDISHSNITIHSFQLLISPYLLYFCTVHFCRGQSDTREQHFKIECQSRVCLCVCVCFKKKYLANFYFLVYFHCVKLNVFRSSLHSLNLNYFDRLQLNEGFVLILKRNELD